MAHASVCMHVHVHVCMCIHVYSFSLYAFMCDCVCVCVKYFWFECLCVILCVSGLDIKKRENDYSLRNQSNWRRSGSRGGVPGRTSLKTSPWGTGQETGILHSLQCTSIIYPVFKEAPFCCLVFTAAFTNIVAVCLTRTNGKQEIADQIWQFEN